MIKLTQLEKDYLHCKYGQREECYKLELVDKYGIKKFDLALKDGSIKHNADTPIKRSATLTFVDDNRINYLTDRVKAYMGIKIKDTLKWYPLGVFLLVKTNFYDNLVDADCFDETIILDQSYILQPKFFQKGTSYLEVLQYFLISCGFIKINIEATNLTLNCDRVFDDSKSKLEWFNTVAKEINYTDLFVNSDGWFVSKKYVEPSPSNVDYVYENNKYSVLLKGSKGYIDFWKTPNVIKRVLNNSKLGEMVSIYKNEDPTNDFSVQKRGFEIVDIKKVDNIASQVELDMLTRKDAFSAMQVTKTVTLPTLNMPTHESLDVLDVRSGEQNGIFVEHGWDMQLKYGSTMNHKIQRLVRLND